MSWVNFFNEHYRYEFGVHPEPQQSDLEKVIEFLEHPAVFPLGMQKTILLSISRGANISSQLCDRLENFFKERRGDAIKVTSFTHNFRKELLEAFKQKLEQKLNLQRKLPFTTSIGVSG